MMSEMKETDLGLLPKSWDLQILGDLLYIKGRIGWKGLKKSEYIEEGYAIINGEQIKSDKVNWNSVGRISKERFLESPEIILKEKDILMTKDGTIGKIAYVDHLPEDATVASGVFVIRKESRLLHTKYLYNFFKSRYFKWLIKGRTEGSVIPHLYQRDFKEMMIPLPSFEEQKAIAKVLTAFDDKIELLQAQNKTLETMSQTIFKEWFGKYQIGDELPEGWRVGCLGDVSINHSKTYKFTDKKVVFINTGDVLEGEFLHKNEISPVGLPGQAKKVIELHDILYSEIRPKNKRFAFVDFDTLNYVVSTKFMIIRTKLDFSPFILYLILKNQVTINEFNSIAESRSGTFPQITFDSIKDFPIVIPSIEAKQKFESILKPIMAKQKVNNNQIQSLNKTRDTLLPKLMSGQVRVNNLNQTANA